tara:strand:- start:190 stop:717 length:528 start_codon:yes stop_codon:yes gene_type:complete
MRIIFLKNDLIWLIYVDLQQKIAQLHQERKYRPVGVFLLCNSENECLIYESTKNKGFWIFPQGGIDSDEKPQDSMYREMKEELGVSKEELENVVIGDKIECLNRPIGRKNRNGFCKGKAYILMRANYSGNNNFKLKKDEVSAVKWVDYSTAKHLFSKLRPKKSELLTKYLTSTSL